MPYAVDTVPGQRYRIEQWRPYLEQEGIQIDFFPFADGALSDLLHKPGQVFAKSKAMAAAFARRALHGLQARNYDVVLVHRTACLAGPALLERLIAMSGKPVIYDFDDAIFLLHTSEANRRFGWLKFPGKTASICRLSTHVVVGNSFLADYARQYNSRVTVISPSVDTNVYQPVPHNGSSSRVVIGWTGSSTSQTHLEMFAPVLQEIAARRNVEIRVISDREPRLPGIPHVWRQWSANRETGDLSDIDIGIMPMPDDQWSRGKCSMKALQYMAMGVPPVCSAIGANCEVIEHGKNGFLATTPEEWVRCLEFLIDDPSLRERLGRQARKTVEEKYSMRRCAELFARVVRDVVEQERSTAKEPTASKRNFMKV
jgi:glycosyltransferase involved in cell wall biosynthesis